MTAPPLKDSRFRVQTINSTYQPQTTCWWAMHQDYSEGFVYDETPPPENEAGRLVVKHLLSGERGHYGPLEHPSITLNVGWFPHSVMQQARTHRIGISFDVQSLRYTGKRICKASEIGTEEALEEVFYLRPVGTYRDRQAKTYEYSENDRQADLDYCMASAWRYRQLVQNKGYAEEHARGILLFDVRQHFVVSFTLRSLLHFLDLRSKKDAQLEIQQLCELIWPHLQDWTPEIADWYSTSRLRKARLAP
jgi:thymidylate synthase (FAD)